MNVDVEIALKLGLALLLGALIGLEREIHRHRAGLRTHMLVCMSCALLIIVSRDIARDMDVIGDPMRVAAGVVTGIGFLGAGTIIKHGATVQGLTTAASIWTSAAVGIAVGAEYYLAAVLVVLLTLFTLYIVHTIDQRLNLIERRSRVIVTTAYRPGLVQELSSMLEGMDVDVADLSANRRPGADGEMMVELRIMDMGGHERSEVASSILELDGVVGVDLF